MAASAAPKAGQRYIASSGAANLRQNLVSHSQNSLSPPLTKTSQSPYYWKREYEVYRSSLLDDLPPDAFAAPQIYALEDFEDCCWIWMEDIVDLKPSWELADYHDIARRLGRFNGACLSARALPDYEWLSHDWHWRHRAGAG